MPPMTANYTGPFPNYQWMLANSSMKPAPIQPFIILRNHYITRKLSGFGANELYVLVALELQLVLKNGGDYIAT